MNESCNANLKKSENTNLRLDVPRVIPRGGRFNELRFVLSD